MNREVCSNLRYCGVPNITSPYRRVCFQSPFVTACAKDNVSCINTYATRGSCYFDAECNSNSCKNGQCATFESSNPKVQGQMSHAEFLQFQASQAETQTPLEKQNSTVDADIVCKNSVLLVRHPNGQQESLCPVPIGQDVLPNCQYALKEVWQCDRYKEQDPKAYATCKSLEQCFVYDAAYPSGELQPVSVRMTAECLGATEAALQQAAMQCTTCQLPNCVL